MKFGSVNFSLKKFLLVCSYFVKYIYTKNIHTENILISEEGIGYRILDIR